MSPFVKKLLATATAAATTYLTSKLGAGPATLIMGGVTFVVAHYFHYQPSPVSTNDTGNP